VSKVRSIVTLGICIVLFTTLLFSNIILAQDGGSYDPWIDTNDDGIIDAIDLQALASIYSTSGTPINKTELLLELEARINSLNASLLMDYYNITECDVIFVDASGDVITGSLDVFGNIQGDTLKSNQIQMGYAELNHDMYFYEDGSPFGEWISWQQIDDEFFISDDTFIWGDMEITGTMNASNLDVAGDIRGEALNVDGIMMGMAEGSHAIFFYENGMMLGEQVCWDDPADAFFMSDDVNIWGNMQTTGDIQCGGAITIPTTTRYYTVPGLAWLPRYDHYNFGRWGSYIYTSTAGTTYWYAPVNLPDGAVVTEFRAWVYDNHAEDIMVQLSRSEATMGDTWLMASVTSSGATFSYRAFSDSTIGSSTIDNQNNAYVLTGVLRSGNSYHRLGQVRITYNITEPLP